MKQASRILDPCNSNLNATNLQGEAKFSESWRASEGCENMPPYRQLKVLLVEDDDSTRHVVAALLRNCGYQVVSAANGLQAWALLMDDERGHDVDLVLTDVVMPGLSGIGLLSRMMHRESLKKIPVIMMSSHDSTDVVFKCLSKGAADFLVKPVRKNELKNLWQHSWRRCQSSESETGKLDNACGENEMKSESGSEDLQVSDQSDTTQSSCTKKVMVELESPLRQKQQHPQQNTSKRRTLRLIRDPEPAENMVISEEEPDLGTSKAPGKQEQVNSPVEAADLIGTIPDESRAAEAAANEELQGESEMGGSNDPEVLKDSPSDPTPTSKLELSLKSLCPVSEENKDSLWRQSGGASAFSRYTTAGGASLTPKRNQTQNQNQNQNQSDDQIHHQDNQQHHHARITDGGSCSSAAATTITTPAGDQVFLTPEQQHQMMNFVQHYPVQYAASLLAFDPHQQQVPGATYYYAQPGGVPPWQHAFSPQSPKEAELILEQQHRQFQTFTSILAQHHHYHAQNHHLHQGASVNRDPQPGNFRETPGCGSTNAPDGVSNNNQFTNGFSGSSHGNNGSMSGSNTGNLNNCGASGTHQMNGDSGSGVNNNSPSSMPVEGAPGPEQSRVRREAALNKFRLKRKERCFDKKVRYQSRKRLAEQRPRVRGQFVSQAVFDSAITQT